jgi:hypothetical protein
MEKLGVALLVLLLAVFIGNVLYKETFADCNSPGQMTWTITLNPDSTCSPGGKKSNTPSSGKNADSVKGLASGANSSTGSAAGAAAGSSTPSGSTASTSSTPTTTNSSLINLSLTDLLALIGSTKDSSGNRMPTAPAYNYRYSSMSIPQPPAPPAPPAPQVYVIAGPATRSFDSQFPSDLRTSRMDPVVGRYAEGNTLGGMATVLEDERIPIGSYSTQQGVQYIKGAPSNNPVAEQPFASLSSENPEYIRKDSIPCYACSL